MIRSEQNPEFDALFDGMLYSLMSWKQLAEFWQHIDTAAGWYLYAIGEERPAAPADAAHVGAFIREIDCLLHKDHREDYCGIVYTDDFKQPKIIKIYDPNHLGASCGSSGSRVLPGWIMSLTAPSDLTPSHFVPQNRRRWWQGFLETIGAA